MHISLIVTDNCKSCERAEQTLLMFQKDYPHIETSIYNRIKFKKFSIQITPALLINDEIFSYGDIDKEKLISKINDLISNNSKI
jgi:hypothetical protein